MRRESLALGMLSACVFVVGTAEYVVTGVLPQLASDLDVAVGTAGQATTAYALGVTIGGPLVTALAVRLPRKTAIVALMALFALGAAVCATAFGFPMLLAGRVLSSLSQAAFFAFALVAAVGLVPPERAGRATSAVVSGLTVATVLGAPLGTLLGQRAGWQAPFAVVTALAVLGGILLAVLLPRQRNTTPGVRAEMRVLTRRPVLLVIATTAIGYAGVATVFAYIAVLLTRITGFGSAAVSALLLAYGVGSVLGNLAAGRLADRDLGLTLRAVFGGLVAVLALMPAAVLWKPTAVLAVLALGLLGTATVAPLQGLILQNAETAPTLAVSVNVSAFNLAIAMGAALGGTLIAAGALRWLGLAGAFLSLIGLALTYPAIPRRAASLAEPEPV